MSKWKRVDGEWMAVEEELYDNGGPLPPATEHVVNNTGEPIEMRTREEWERLAEEHPQRFVQGLPPPGEYVKPDWDRARNMIDALERGDLAPDHEETEAIGCYLDDGTCIFRICADGTVEAPDMDRLGEAAVIFFKQVLRVAKLQGFKVPENPEGWDA